MLGFLRNLGTVEVIIIALVILFFFGGKKLSGLARGLGESKKELKTIKKDVVGKKSAKKEDEKDSGA